MEKKEEETEPNKQGATPAEESTGIHSGDEREQEDIDEEATTSAGLGDSASGLEATNVQMETADEATTSAGVGDSASGLEATNVQMETADEGKELVGAQAHEIAEEERKAILVDEEANHIMAGIFEEEVECLTRDSFKKAVVVEIVFELQRKELMGQLSTTLELEIKSLEVSTAGESSSGTHVDLEVAQKQSDEEVSTAGESSSGADEVLGQAQKQGDGEHTSDDNAKQT